MNRNTSLVHRPVAGERNRGRKQEEDQGVNNNDAYKSPSLARGKEERAGGQKA